MTEGVRLERKREVAAPVVDQDAACNVGCEVKAPTLKDVFEKAKAALGDNEQHQHHLDRIKESPIFELVMTAKDNHVEEGLMVQPEHVLLQLMQDRKLPLGDRQAQLTEWADENR